MGMIPPVQMMQNAALQQMLIQQSEAAAASPGAVFGAGTQSVPINFGINSFTPPNSAFQACNQPFGFAPFSNAFGAAGGAAANGKTITWGNPSDVPAIEDVTKGPCLFCEGAHATQNCDKMIKAKRANSNALREKNAAAKALRLAKAAENDE